MESVFVGLISLTEDRGQHPRIDADLSQTESTQSDEHPPQGLSVFRIQVLPFLHEMTVPIDEIPSVLGQYQILAGRFRRQGGRVEPTNQHTAHEFKKARERAVLLDRHHAGEPGLPPIALEGSPFRMVVPVQLHIAPFEAEQGALILRQSLQYDPGAAFAAVMLHVQAILEGDAVQLHVQLKHLNVPFLPSRQ